MATVSSWRRWRLTAAVATAGWMFLVVLQVGFAQGQSNSVPTTDPWEAKALSSIFEQWGLNGQMKWNSTEDPCSGKAIDGSSVIDGPENDPFIRCNCNFNNGTTCHISALKVYSLDAIGVIPDELWNFTFLTNLDLRQNYLTGPLSSSIGNLTQMQYLSVGVNALSGEIPKEIGLLTDLRSLSFATNNFSGSLPSELGNLTKLTQLYITGSGFSGQIPSTFAKLQSLKIMQASDNNFTGFIPEFIGSWTKLTDLRLQGNSFVGTIPSSFSNLTYLQDLRVSDLSNGSSSLAFIKDMKNLTTLILRNNNISDSIPSTIGEYPNLSQLDLSFNNITGNIPDSLFNRSSLSFLFLGSNRLTGSLPTQKSDSLLNIDLSYNELSGSIPSWVSQSNLQLNLVGNNFSESNLKSSALPSGLDCLQNNFPCHRGSPIYSSFAIKCGGPEIIAADKTVYDRDNETLGAASYFLDDKQQWAVSNVGFFEKNDYPSDTVSLQLPVANTLSSELFQTTRLSRGSLRYYGLGLENGNYTVLLQFAEIQFDNGQTWRSLGRRIFDIYIQGIREFKDFDIRKETGGQSYEALQKKFTAQVTANYLDIHFFWAGKGTCCVPNQGVYGPSISAIRVSPNFLPTVSNLPQTTKKDRTGLIVGVFVGVGILGLICIAACLIIRRRRSLAAEDEGHKELLGIDNKPYTLSYSELKLATEDFIPDNKLGEGGFGPVYKGTLNDGRVVAVKQLSVKSHQGKNQFVAEIATISAVQHRNLVKLYGCCIDRDRRLLVYEYLENKSLDKLLFERTDLELSWEKRFDICMGVARGLAYLHEESRFRIVHRDVKASNILLDSALNPKISDFGLAKLYDDKVTHISTRVAGTIGYLAPEYALRGHLTEKVDVFGFGVVALEIVTGRINSDSTLPREKEYLLEWAWQLHDDNRELELVDERVSVYNMDEVKRVIGIALLCTQTSPGQRPPMSRVLGMLSGHIEVVTAASKPGYLTDWKFVDESFQSSTSTTRVISSTTTTSALTDAHNTARPSPDDTITIDEGR